MDRATAIIKAIVHHVLTYSNMSEFWRCVGKEAFLLLAMFAVTNHIVPVTFVAIHRPSKGA
jgi:hypothetical protein